MGNIKGVRDAMGVFVALGVADGTRSTPGPTVGVQVGGRETIVGVDVGTTTMGTSVAGGKGFNGLVGEENKVPTRKTTPMIPRTNKIDKKSQIENFISILLS